MEKLKKLKGFYEEGFLSKAEYDTRRLAIIDEMQLTGTEGDSRSDSRPSGTTSPRRADRNAAKKGTAPICSRCGKGIKAKVYEEMGRTFDSVCYRLAQVSGYDVKVAGLAGDEGEVRNANIYRDLGNEEGRRKNEAMMKSWPAEKKKEHKLMQQAYGNQCI